MNLALSIFRHLSLLLISIVFIPPSSYAEDQHEAWQQITPSLKIAGSARLRYENKQNFNFGALKASNTQDYWLHQLRLNMHWQANSHVSVYLEGQDSRIHQAFRNHVINTHASPNIFEDHFDLHQGYIDISTGDQASQTRIRLGRQKLNFGAQRMIASLEWVNTARVWDGAHITSQLGKANTLDVFSTRLVPVNPRRLNNHATTASRMFNSSFHGIYYTNRKQLIADTQLELYGLLREEARVGDRVYTWGTRLAYQHNHFDSDAEAMLQTGSYGNQQQQAYALHAGVGYQLDALNSHIGAAYNFASGDSNANDNTHQTFDNQYPLNHAYYGYMDFFSLQNMHNAEVAIKTNIAQTWILRAAWQGFWLAKPSSDAWYNAGAGIVRPASVGASSKVGDEIDITLKHRFSSLATTLYIGYSHFFTGAYISQTGASRDADFGFMQTKTSF